MAVEHTAELHRNVKENTSAWTVRLLKEEKQGTRGKQADKLIKSLYESLFR